MQGSSGEGKFPRRNHVTKRPANSICSVLYRWKENVASYSDCLGLLSIMPLTVPVAHKVIRATQIFQLNLSRELKQEKDE